MNIFHDGEHARHNARIYADNCETVSNAIDKAVALVCMGAGESDCIEGANLVVKIALAKISKDAGQAPDVDEAALIADTIMNEIMPERVEEQLKEDALNAVRRYATALAVRAVDDESLTDVCEGFASCSEIARLKSRNARTNFAVKSHIAFVESFEECINNELSARGMH